MPPQLGRHSSFQATSSLFAEPRFKEELDLAKQSFAERQREKEAELQEHLNELIAIIQELFKII